MRKSKSNPLIRKRDETSRPPATRIRAGAGAGAVDGATRAISNGNNTMWSTGVDADADATRGVTSGGISTTAARFQLNASAVIIASPLRHQFSTVCLLRMLHGRNKSLRTSSNLNYRPTIEVRGWLDSLTLFFFYIKSISTNVQIIYFSFLSFLCLSLSLCAQLFPAFPSRFFSNFLSAAAVVTMVGKGRKKVENKLIEDPSSRMVCFSKRRKGLFKKADELSILSGAKIGVLAFSQAGKLYCSDAQTLDSLLCPQADIPSEDKDMEVAFESAFAEAMVEELYSSDLPTLNPQLVISSDDGWESAFAEAVDANLYCSDDDHAATLDSLLCPQFNMISTEKEVGICWEFDFADTMAGKHLPFWYDRPDVQSMGSEELQRFERAIMEYAHIQFDKNMGR